VNIGERLRALALSTLSITPDLTCKGPVKVECGVDEASSRREKEGSEEEHHDVSQ
jgi:hypothetical protein